MKKTCLFLAAAALVAASMPDAHAQYYVSGAFNSWASPSPDVLGGAGPIYSCAVSGQTPDGLSEFKISSNSWAVSWPSANVSVKWDANGSNNFYFQPGTFSDGWFPAADRVGFGDPGGPWEIIGGFNGWDGSQPANAQMTSNGSGLYTVDYVITNAGSYEFKFRRSGTWGDLQSGSQFMNGSQNAAFATVNSPQTIRFQIDLPNGRFNIGIPPVTNYVVFAVDMTVQKQVGKFDPNTDAVLVSGAFNSWPGTGAGALVLTNDPPYNGGSNTNIYYATNMFIGLPGSFGSDYKFTTTATAYSSSEGYEPLSNNRSFNLMTVNGNLMLPVVRFGNLYLSDYATASTLVTFTVNMTNATTTGSHVFDPANDQVYINGSFVAGGWASWDPIGLASQIMVNDPPGSQVYTYTASVPAGSLIEIDYKYAVNYPGNTGSLDNEAPAYQDHYRYIRMTATGSYTNSMDTFGNQYVEPSFGQLTSAGAGAGNVTVSWSGRPGVQLQVNNDLAGGTWQSISATDGTNWSNGYTSPSNGFMSQTNWPAVDGQQFFLLIQAW
jgi:hypothetical protein